MIVYYNPADTDVRDIYHDWIPDELANRDVEYRSVKECPVGVVRFYDHRLGMYEGVMEITNHPIGMPIYVPYQGEHNLEGFRLLKPRDRCVKCGNWNKYCMCSEEDKAERLFDLLGGIRADNMDDELQRWLND